MQNLRNNDTSVQESTLKIIAELLTDICEESTTTQDTNNVLIKPFLTKKIPSISIKQFFERIVKYTKLENSTLVLILIYIDRLCDIQKFRLNYYNIHKIIVAAMIIAIKYNEDDYFDSIFYSKVGGVSRKELDKLEYQMLALINFELYVSEAVFNKYNNYIKSVEVEDETEEDEIEEETCKKKNNIITNDLRMSIPVS